MFIRFVVGYDGDYHKDLTGIITSARLLRDEGALTQNEESYLESIYEWFNEFLPCPPFFKKN